MVIKANELRIGNWVDDPTDGQQKRVNIYQLGKSMVTDVLSNYTAIPLTPEILVECGFELDGFKHYNLEIPTILTCSNITITFAGDYLYLEEPAKRRLDKPDLICLWNKDLMKVFYLHQLQNLYFALTGEELNINL